MKKYLALVLAILFVLLSFAGCGNRRDPSQKIDELIDDLVDDYSRYQDDREPPPSVLDKLDLMLDHYVSGLATPPPSGIPSSVVDPDGADAQAIVSTVSSAVKDEADLEALILQTLKNAETGVTFEVKGNWLNWDLLYDIVFHRIHDVYMIDAFGLYSYTAVETSNGTNDVYQLTYTYIENSTPDEIRDMRKEIVNRAKDVVGQLNVGSKSDYEIISAIDRYLCDSVYYPDEPYIPHDHTPYGTLVSGRAVCEGYARTCKILCELCGLDCYYVVGYCGNDPVGGGHAWNLVKVDGKWYQLDITWNDGGESRDYFLVTDDFMRLSRDWEAGDYPPSEKVPYAP